MNPMNQAARDGTVRAPHQDRTQAGISSARRLGEYAGRADAIVLAVPRGGVPVGVALAQTLGIAIDVVVAGPDAPQAAAEVRRRERLYRGSRPPLQLAGRRAILVDDGVATGATLLAAIEAARRLRPRTLTLALPVAAPATLATLAARVDHLACLATPAQWTSIAACYALFDRISDKEVQDLLAHAWHTGAPSPTQPNGETDHDADHGHRL